MQTAELRAACWRWCPPFSPGEKPSTGRLPTREMLEVAGWLDERRGMITNSEALFQQLDEEEGESAGQQWWRD
ncbi:MAG: hypothetical protein DVB27_09145 [Verrucomicrobia bacterium]|nr:MAG: hypothetical protein DVB27_09145 [Verrucomicrobiota bacterium]